MKPNDTGHPRRLRIGHNSKATQTLPPSLVDSGTSCETAEAEFVVVEIVVVLEVAAPCGGEAMDLTPAARTAR